MDIKNETKEIIKSQILNLLKQLDPQQIQELLFEIQDELEAMGILILAEETFGDWENEEDSYYDGL